MGTRRDFIKKAAYAAPVVMTMTARPSFAGKGSDGPVGTGKPEFNLYRQDRTATKPMPKGRGTNMRHGDADW